MKNNEQQLYSVGELANATGLTVRTLQHYDNIGLLPTSGRTEGGRRFYTNRDVVRLTQITIYKSIGFPLAKIREKLSVNGKTNEIINIFLQQMPIVLKKIDDLHMALTVLSTSINFYRTGKEPPLEILAELIRTTEGSGLNEWNGFPFETGISQALTDKSLSTLHGAMNFYHIIRELLVEAIALNNADTAADNPTAQRLAQDWWEKVIIYTTNGEAANVDAMLKVDKTREIWPSADRKLYEMAEPFIESVLAVYMEKNNLKIPLTKEELKDD